MKAKTGSTSVVLLTFAAILLYTPPPLVSQAPTAQVRLKWQDFVRGPEGARRLGSLEKGIAKMKSLDGAPKTSVDYRRSWEYWANIHGYYGPASMDGTVEEQIQYLNSNGLGQYDSYYSGIVDQTPPDAEAAAVWATCQHSYRDQNNNWVHANFWGWHRMYPYYFERVLRWAAEDETLRLPYWDYTNPAQTALPVQFRHPGSVLYDQKRSPQVNQGTPLDPDTTDINPVLLEPDYISAEFLLERGVHGHVHCETAVQCPVAHMGDVPVAGNDPIFYEHHANIDRIWACWQKAHPPVAPGASWETQEFSFPDETGALQTKPVSDFLSTETLGYVYDHEDNCARPSTLQATSMTMAFSQESGEVEKRFPQLVTSKSTVILSPSVTTVELPVTRPTLQKNLVPGPRPSTQLVLRDLSAQSPPGQLLKIYVASKSRPQRKLFVAAVSWFNDFGHDRRGPSTQNLSYDVTAQLRSLGVTNGTAGITVSFEAANGLVSPKTAAAVKSAPLASFRPEARLTIGAVELRQTSPAQ